MATTIKIDVDSSGAVTGTRVVKRELQDVENTAKRTGSATDTLRRAAVALGTAFAAIKLAGLITDLARAADEMRLLEQRINVLTRDATAFDQLAASANKLGVSFQVAGEGFSRFALAGKEIGLTTEEVVKLNQTVLQLGRIGGGSQQQLTAGAIQLGQALASGRLQGDELRSILENMPLLAQKLAAEIGVGVGQLRKLGSEGKLTSNVIAASLLRIAEETNEEFAKLPTTVAQSSARMANAFTELQVELDETFRISENLKSLYEGIAEVLKEAAAVLRSFRGAETTEDLQSELDEVLGRIKRIQEEGTGFPALMQQQINKLYREAEEITSRMLRDVPPLKIVVEPGGVGPEIEAVSTAYDELARRVGLAQTELSVFAESGMEALEFKRLMIDALQIAEKAVEDYNKDNEDAIAADQLRAATIADFLPLARQAVLIEDDLATAIEETKDAQKAANDAKKEGERITESLRTAEEIYADRIDDLTRLLNAGAISQETFNRALKDANDALREAQIEANAFASAIKDAVGQIENNFQQLFADIFQNGLDGFQDFADGILDIFKRLAAQIATQFVIGDILGLGTPTGLLGGSGGVGGVISSVSSIISPTSILGDLLGLGGAAPAAGGAAGALGGGASSFLSAPLNFISQILGGGASSAVGGLASNVALSAIGQSLGLSTGFGGSTAAQAAVATGPELFGGLTGAGSQFVTGAAQLATLPVAAPLGFLALGVMEALGNTSSGPAVGTNFDTANGRIENFRVTTDNGGSTELGNALGEAIQAVVNSALDRSGGSLVDGAFDGEVGFANGRFGSSIISPGIASQDFRGFDSLGIFGITDDLRKNFGRRGTDEDSMRGAIVDFVSRNFIDALDRGLIDGVSDEAAATMRIGFGNLARAAANGLTEADFKQAIADIDFIAGFDQLAENLRVLGDTSATAAERLDMATESQESFNASLEEVRSSARSTAAEAGSPLAGISDFVSQAVRVFDPKGPLSFQLRTLLEGNQDGTVSESLTRQIVSNGRFGFTTDPTVAIGAGPINGRGGRNINLEPNADQLFSILASNINDDAGFQRLGRNVSSGFQETLLGDPTTLFQQLGDFDLFGVNFVKNLDLSSVEEAVFDVFGPDGEFVTTFRNQFERAGDQVDYVSLTRDLVNTLIEAGAQVPDDLPIDPFFDDGRDRVAEALQIAKDQVEAYFAGVTETISEQIDGPLALFEEIVPAVSPLVTQFEEIKAQVEATVPDLEALNEDLAAFGQELINVGEITTDAINSARNATQDEFLAGLGIGVNSDGTLSGSTIDFGGIGALAETIKALDLNSASLFEVDERGLLPQVQGRIDELLVEGINALLGEAESYSDTLAQIENVFGDRINGLNGILAAPTTSEPDPVVTPIIEAMPDALARFFADSVLVQESNDALQVQIDAQTVLAEEAQAAADSLSDLARRAGDNARSLESAVLGNSVGDLSPLSPADRLAAARTGFNDAVALARTGNIDDADVQAAITNLPNLQRDFLTASRDYYGNSEEYLADFNTSQAALAEIAADQRSLEARYLSEAQTQTTLLESINAGISDMSGQIVANDNRPAYVAKGDGQYVATGVNGISAGFDLGRRPDVAIQILQALRAANLATPGGFGEGQLNALRDSDPNVDAVVRALGFANGGVFSAGNVVPFANGGIVNRPTAFRLGVMGEAGPEAIMPLRRGADGALGVSGGMDPQMARMLADGFARLEARMAAVEANTGQTARETSLARTRPQRPGKAA